jgi:alanyl-tRNA synthetase
MKSSEIRQKFLDFFKSKGHAIISSASLIPENDPSVLFTTAGMHPLVPYLLGEPHPQGKRLADVQKCVRTGDIDEVGDKTHLTFFEMLGNWSLGDYFKKESIAWSYEFLTDKNWLGIDPSMLAVTVFAGDESTPRDDESVAIWKSHGIKDDRIAYLGKDDNWWPAGGKHPGPQGPDTEIFYWTGGGNAPAKYDPSDKRWVEIWNNVFMQFNNDPGKGLTPLAKQNVDTGMGLERVTAVLNGKDSVYETDLFERVLKTIAGLTDERYESAAGRSMRIIADHIRAATFMLGDERGIAPSNVDQGYILRRLIRRAVRHGRQLGIKGEFLEKLADDYIEQYRDAYPELQANASRIKSELQREEEKFGRTLEKGLKEFEKIFQKANGISGEDAFTLFSTYGFPLELTEELAREKGQVVDRARFEEEFRKHQDLSRAGAGQKFAGGLADHSAETVALHTATHMLHQALRTVLGDHVFQKGSNITKERLRFDFSHPEKMTPEQIKRVEDIVNENIRKDLPVHFEILDLDDAKKRGAIGVFDDKYAQLGGKVKVYFIGDQAIDGGYYSKEVCGGPHVEHTGQMGRFRIAKEEASSAGIRRIKAVLDKA